jgi:hypothetical protein
MLLAALAVVAGGCGARQSPSSAPGASASPSASAAGAGGGAALPQGHPQAVDPVAGAVQQPGNAGIPGQVSVGPSGGAVAQPVSDADIRRQLAASGIAANQDQATFVPGGLAIAPIGAPAPVQAVINAGNTIARLPYRFGGGHGTFQDSEYDCSGSLSFVLAAAGLLNTTMTSGELMSWGAPGPGKWITIFANQGHTFMYVAGLRFDTVARAETGSRWSNKSATEREGFAIRHPPGL